MSLLVALPKILEESRIEYEEAKTLKFIVKEVFSDSKEEPLNILAKGNNLAFIKYLMEDDKFKGKLKMVYIDPPFFSQADYGMNIEFILDKEKTKVKKKAYTDIWESGMEGYLKMLCIRLFGIRDLLAEDGCLWVHLDWHSVHYVKVLMDEIFGEKNFVNEVIWQYKSGGTSKRHFSRKHDTLLFYAKNNDYFFKPQQEKSYNRGLKPYRFKGVNEYRDDFGWHTLVNMKDVWQIDMVGRTSKERTGYATQKPEALLERIMESCTQPGDYCADFFSGSATLGAIANKLNRNWVCCDIGNLAIVNSLSRLAGRDVKFSYYEEETLDEITDTGTNITAHIIQEKIDEMSQLIQIELKNFIPELVFTGGLSAKDRKTVEQVLKEDPFLLVEYWSIDYHYDGFVHRPKEVFIKGSKELVKKSESLTKGSKLISIRILDSFGKSYHKVIDLLGGGEHEKNQ